MKLIYGRGIFVDLNITDAGDYGFDTAQLKNLHSGTPVSKVRSEVTNMDNHFDPNLDFVLSFTPDGDPRMDGGSGVGWINRDSWYDNANSTFYEDMEDIFDSVTSEYGDRFKGIRWNHEHRPREFREGSKWREYAEDNASSDYRKVRDSRQTEWTKYLTDLAGKHSRDAYKNIGEAQKAPYNTSRYTEVKRLYKHFVDFQCKAQARMMDILAGKLAGNRKVIFYPVQDGPNLVHAVSEYAVDFSKVTHRNVIGEIGTWDTYNHKIADRNEWAKQQGSRPYFFALQQARDNEEDVADEDHITARTNRVQQTISKCLDPTGAEDPWDDSFAFWNRWRDEDDKRGDPEITLAEQRAYMNRVRNELT